jgi:RNA-directed DNA polymerase
VISPLLANLYLHPLDVHLTERGYRMVRYADDLVILCASLDEAQEALQELRHWVEANGLHLHPEKTRVGDCRQPGEGFEFLGYRFEAGRRWVRKKSRKALNDRIRADPAQSRGRAGADCGRPQPDAAWLVCVLPARTPVDLPPNRRFCPASITGAAAQAAEASGSGSLLFRPSPLAERFFAAAGLFTMTEARTLASQSRCG